MRQKAEKGSGQPGGGEDSPVLAGPKRLLKPLIAFLVLAALALAAVGGRYWWLSHDFLNNPPEEPGREVSFLVEPGQPFLVIARNLKSQSLVKDVGRFVKLASKNHKTGEVRAGEFLLNTGWLPHEILNVLTSTPGVMTKIQIREGLTWWQTAKLVEDADLGGFEEFRAVIHDPAFLAEHGIPAESAEGYLFPETYLLTMPRKDKASIMAATMVKEFRRNISKIWPDNPPSPEEIHKLVVLASLVEKETGVPEERRRIAGVFANRLKRGMLIQADPATIYGLGPDFNGNLTRKHLDSETNSYNTYKRPGLPPGPICSPGLESIKAAARPEEHNYLYFVAKGDGTHHFSKNFAEHDKAVTKYQLRRNRQTYRSIKE